jgi:hypothetical protein
MYKQYKQEILRKALIKKELQKKSFLASESEKKSRLREAYLEKFSKKSTILDKNNVINSFKYTRIQQKSLSCELSAASDILSTLENKNITEDELISHVGKSMYNQLPINIR